MKPLHLIPLLLPLTTYAWPTTLVPRGKSNGLLSILEFIKDQTSTDVDAWDYDELPDMCLVQFSTYGGGHCYMSVTCNDGKKEYTEWQVCEIEKRQYWRDDRIGDFSIEYTTAGGINSDLDGLHGPLLRVKTNNDWEAIDLDDLDVAQSADAAEKHDYDKDGPRLCYYDFNDGSVTSDGKKREWGCGIPKLGKGFEEMQNDIPDGDGGYAPGQCGIHIIQYQKPVPGVDPYSLEISIKDANGDEVGKKSKTAVPENILSVTSKLPHTVDIATGEEDHQGLVVAYGEDIWSTDTEEVCSVGKYDNGNREMDCGFACE